MAELIYVADDDLNLLEVQRAFLEGAGYQVSCFATGDALRERFLERPADLVILDVMMPGTDGLEVCRQLREVSDVPIVILTARESEMDYITGLALGDDYLFKPFSPSMLVMRVRALLRRANMSRGQEGGTLRFADLVPHDATHVVEVGGRELRLTMMEFSLLRVLMKAAGEPVSRAELLRRVWGMDAEVETRVTDECARRVRQKLRGAGSRVGVKAVWGFDYRLVDAGEGDAHAPR